MKVTEYFVGFGPRLWSVRRGETEYGVKAIPAGGYVRITGFTSTEEVDEEDEAARYRQQPFHQRIIVASAGSAMHFLIALVLALIVVLGYGQLTNNYKVTSLEHWNGKTTPATIAGLKAGDTIVSIDGKTFSSPTTMQDTVGQDTGKQITLGVERDGRLIHLTATPESGKGVKVDGQKLENRGYLGINIGPAPHAVGLLSAPGAAVSTLWGVTTRRWWHRARSSPRTGSPPSGTNSRTPRRRPRPPTILARPRDPRPSSASRISVPRPSRQGSTRSSCC